MTSIQEKTDFLASRIWSTQTWLEMHGRHSKKPRPETDIEKKEHNLTLYEAMQSDYLAAQQRRAG